MAKAAKIVDVQDPGTMAPTASSRPIVVNSNRPVLANDPMMVTGDKAAADAPANDPVKHTAKVIAPLDQTVVPATETDVTALPDDSHEADLRQEPEPVEAASTAEVPAEDEPIRDAAAESAAVSTEAEAARAAREQELESLIEKGTYVLPIDSMRRQRSHRYALLAVILTLIILAVVLDIVLDRGLLKPPLNLPHTHFFAS